MVCMWIFKLTRMVSAMYIMSKSMYIAMSYLSGKLPVSIVGPVSEVGTGGGSALDIS